MLITFFNSELFHDEEEEGVPIKRCSSTSTKSSLSSNGSNASFFFCTATLCAAE